MSRHRIRITVTTTVETVIDTEDYRDKLGTPDGTEVNLDDTIQSLEEWIGDNPGDFDRDYEPEVKQVQIEKL